MKGFNKMLNSLIKINYLLLLLLLPVLIHSQNKINIKSGSQRIERFIDEQGFNQNTVSAIISDSYGDLWFGTPNGLVKYDGYLFEYFYHDVEDKKSIPNNYIANLLNDSQGRLWIDTSMTEFFKRKSGRELARTIRWDEIGKLPVEPTLEDVRPYLHTRNNAIEANELHHGMEKMGDGNAIYIRGAGAGNKITRNYIHDMVAPMIMQCAIRTDGGQMDTFITENLIYNCVSQGIMLKLNNVCENNIVANIIAPPRGYYLSVREGPLTGAVIKKNIFYSMGQPTEFINELKPGGKNTGEDARGRLIAMSKEADTDFNIYYSSVDSELGKTFLTTQQGDGVDKNSQSIDPLFVDPENGDFRFKPNSPALKMGIKEIDISKIGLQNKEK